MKQTNNMNAVDDYASETSQRELAAGVLKQAANDLRRFHGATSEVERELYLDAYSWVISDDFSCPFSFLKVCYLLVALESLVRNFWPMRRRLFAATWRRGGRVARSFQSFFNRIFTTSRNAIAVDPVPPTHVPIG
jgi:hypothetical protein